MALFIQRLNSLSQLKLNIFANYIGKFWSNLLSFLLVPVYLHYLGVEVYGLIGAFYAVTSFVNLLDLGLGTTINREVALRKSIPEKRGSIPNLLKTTEIIYWCIGLGLVVLMALLAQPIATQWFKIEKLHLGTVRWVVLILGLTVAIRWPVTPYRSTLIALEKQVPLNIGEATLKTFRELGAVVILVWISPTIMAFLVWQSLLALAEVFLMMILAWHFLPVKKTRPCFEFNILGEIWRFAIGMNWITVVSLLLTQMDKILLSKLVSLEQFGYYSMANTLASSIVTFFHPFSIAISPHFTALVAQGEEQKLKEIFHKSSLFISLLLTPVATMLMFCAPTILEIWIRSPEVVTQASHPLRLLTFGMLMGSLFHVQYLLQLAIGKPQIYALFGSFSLILVVPAMFWLISHFELVGAALVWAILNTAYYLILSRMTHRYILHHEYQRWLFQDTLIPIVLCFAVDCIVVQVQSAYPGIPTAIISIAIGLGISYGLLGLWYTYQMKYDKSRLKVKG